MCVLCTLTEKTIGTLNWTGKILLLANWSVLPFYSTKTKQNKNQN